MTSRPAATHPIYTYTNNYCVCVRVFDCLRWTIRSFSLRVCFYPYVVKRSLNSGENVQLSLSFAVVPLSIEREKKEIGEQTEELSFSIQRSFTPFFNENMVCMTRSIGYKAD